MSGYQIHFRTAQSSLPREIQARIDKKEENDGNFCIFQGKNGYSWARISKRIVIWSYDKHSHQNEINLHEIAIPDKFFTKSISLHACAPKAGQKTVCVFMTSQYGDLCFWQNADAPSKFYETFVNISPRTISSILLFNYNEYFIILSDGTIIQIIIESDKINYHFVSTKGIIPKVITTILSPFTRRNLSLENVFHEAFRIETEQDPNYNYICINNQTEIKIYKLSKTFPSILIQEKSITKLDIKRKLIEDFGACEFNQISFCSAISVKNWIYSIIEAYCVDIQEFKYFVSKIKLSSDLSINEEILIQLECSLFEKISKSLMCYSSSLKAILITIKDRMLIFECNTNTVAILKIPNSESTPTAISYCKNSLDFLIMLDDFKFYYLGQRVDHSFNHSLIRNSSVDYDRSSLAKSEISTQTQTALPEDSFGQLDYYFKKFITLQKNFPNSISNIRIQNSDLISEISSLSDYLITNTTLETEATSISRKLQNIIKNSENFLKFLKETNLAKQSLFYSGNSNQIKKSINLVLLNIERSKLSFLLYEASDQNSYFFKLLQDENSKILNDSQISGLVQRAEEIFSNIIINSISMIENLQKNESKSFLDFVSLIILKSLDIYFSTSVEIKNLAKNVPEVENLKKFDLDKGSFITNKEIYQILLDFITFGIKFENKNNLQITKDLIFKICQKLLEILYFFIDFSIFLNNDKYLEIFNSILACFEGCDFIDRALELSILFKNFHHVIRLCVEYKRMDVLDNLKLKWREDNFDSKISEWLATNKCWSLLSEHVNRGNIEEICQNIPHLSWIYFLKQNDLKNTKNALKAIAKNEENLFFQKTYCAIHRLCELSQDSKPDSEISYYLNKINFQLNKKPFTFVENFDEKVLKLHEVLFNHLFSDDVVITIDLLLKSFNLILESEIKHSIKIIALVWSAVILFDPYLKYNDTVMKSSCQNNSFFYQSLKTVFDSQYPEIFYDESLCMEVFSFINSTFEHSQPGFFFQRTKCVYEIFQDCCCQNSK